MTATILVGMSIAEADARDELLAAAAREGASIAFLQMADPSLSAELTRLADEGHPTITLIGVSRGPLAPGQSWLSRIAAYWLKERTGTKPEVRVAKRLATELDDLPRETRPVTTYEPGLTSDAWETVSSHRHQVNICRGPRCTAKGAVDNLRAMVLAMMEHDVTDDDVLLVHTGCQFPCNQAPVVSVQPDDVWYGQVDPAAASEIVTSHLIGGAPLAEKRLSR
ncbi:(2Fe-2S) ferredoxin domain-containing protein [Nocardioides montaniterrae]